jgi:hypothetical protein
VVAVSLGFLVVSMTMVVMPMAVNMSTMLFVYIGNIVVEIGNESEVRVEKGPFHPHHPVVSHCN